MGCSITEIDGDRYTTPVFAGEAAVALDLVQYQTGQGPCLFAVRDQRRYIVDEHSDLIWSLPGWARSAARHGVGGVLSVPLARRESTGLNFYAASAETLRRPVVMARAELVGRVVALLLTGSAAASRPGAREAGAREAGAPGGRALLARARAVVARTEGITDRQAFTWLARQSARAHRSIFATAAEILADPGRDDTEPLR